MTSLHDLPVGKKLAALLLLFVLGLAAYVGFVFQTALTVRANSEQARNAYPLLLLIGDCGRLTTEMRDLYTVAVTSQDSDMLDAARQQARRVQVQIDKLVTDAALNDIRLSGLATAFTAYANAADAWAGAMVSGGGSDQAQARLYQLAQRQQTFGTRLDESRAAINATFSSRLRAIEADAGHTWQVGLFGGVALSLLMLALNTAVSRRMIVAPLHSARDAMARIADGEWDEPVPAGHRDEVGELLAGIEQLRVQLKDRRDADEKDDFHANLLAELNVQMRGDLGVAELCDRVIRYLTPITGCQLGLLYVKDGEVMHPVAAYALRLENVAPVPTGRSLVGQVAQSGEPALLREVPESYAHAIATGSARARPRHVAVLPVHHDGELVAVLELGAVNDFDDNLLGLIRRCSEHFAVMLTVAQSRSRAAAVPAAHHTEPVL